MSSFESKYRHLDQSDPQSVRSPERPRPEATAGLPLYLQAGPVQRQVTAEEEEIIQPRFTVGPVDDPYEREADQVADQVMGQTRAARDLSAATAEQVQRQARQEEEDEVLQAEGSAAGDGRVSASFQSDLQTQRGGGAGLPQSAREFMESRMGSDFSHVRVHQGPQASRLNQQVSARAFTVGSDIFFGAGQYRPDSEAGRHLLAHELTHVMQQTGTRPKGPGGATARVSRALQRLQRKSLQDELEQELAEWAEKHGKTTDPKHKDYAFDLQEYAWSLITDPDPSVIGPLPKPKGKKARKAWEKKFKKAELLAKKILAGGPKVVQKEDRAAMILNYMAQAGFGQEAVALTASMTDEGQIEYVYGAVLDRIESADPQVLTRITEWLIKHKGKSDNPLLEKFSTSSGDFEKKLNNARLKAILKPLIHAYEKDAFLIDIVSQVLLRKKGFRKVFSDWMWKENKGDLLFKVLQSKWFIEPEYGPTVLPDVGELKMEKDMPWVYANKQKYYVGYLVQLGKDTGVKIDAPKSLKFRTLRSWLDDNTDKFGAALAKKHPDDQDKWIKTYEEIADIFFYHVSGRNINPDLAGKLGKLGPGAPAKLRLKADCDVLSTYAMRFFDRVRDPDNPAFKAFEPIGYMALDPKDNDGHSVALMRRKGKYFAINNKEVSDLKVVENKPDAKKEAAIKALKADALLIYDEKPQAYKVYYADAVAGGAMPKALSLTKEDTRREDLEP